MRIKFPSVSSLRHKLNISRLAIAHPRITIAFWLAISIAGLLAFSSLKYGLFPDISFPVVVINAKGDLTTILETETKLTKPLEETLNNVPEIDDMISSTYTGQTTVSLFFFPSQTLEASTQAVKETLKNISLPPQTSLEIIPFNLNESNTVTYALESKTKSLKELTEIAHQEIIPLIGQIKGVLKVNLLGNDSVKNNFTSNLSVDNFPTLVNFNGQEALAFQVIKKSNANTLEIVKEVEKTVKNLQNKFPEVKFILAETQAEYIKEATQATIDALIEAIILSILIIFPFLSNPKATLISALAIPISLLGTFIVMAIAGFQLETITLLALALVIGIIVDDAIVDVENISRHIEAGLSPKQAAILGTDEIGLTISASTLTIVAVFLPVGLMGGSVGQFFKPFGLTVSASVLISLLIARTLSPVLAIYWLKPQSNQSSQRQIINLNTFGKKYRNLLNWSLNHRKIVIAIAVLSFLIGIALIPLIPQGFIPQLERNSFNITYTTPLPKINLNISPTNPTNSSPKSTEGFNWIGDIVNSPERLLLRKTNQVGQDIEKVVLDNLSVESVFTIMGIQGNPTQGKIYVKLKDERDFTTTEVENQIRQNLPKIKGVTISVEDIPFIDLQAQKPLQLLILGNDLDTLTKTAQIIKDKVGSISGLVDVSIAGTNIEAGNMSQIDHYEGKRVIYLTANLNQDIALGDVINQVFQTAQPFLPPGITMEKWGDSARAGEVMGSFGSTLLLSTICMLGLLWLIFGRLLEPIVVGLSLPLSIVGAMLGLLIAQSDFGIISLIGLIFLLGLLDKNAVLLMDYINQLRQAGKNRTEAILETGMVRLRPIIMTTASTILGMLPLAIGWGAGAELRQPMAVAIIGGLITSSLLTLIVVPVLYTLLEDWGQKKAH